MKFFSEVSKMKTESKYAEMFKVGCKAGLVIFGLTYGSAFAAGTGIAAQHVVDEANKAKKSGADLAEQATNPVAPLMQIRLQYQYSPTTYNGGGHTQAGIFQGVFPVALPFKAVPKMVNRVTTPYLSTPDFGEPIGRKVGLSDTSILAFFVPDFGLKGHVIALGPSINIPTAGDNEFTGSGQWELGPAAVYLNTQTKGTQWGGMVFRNWDVSSTRSGAASVDKTSIQPIVNIHFKEGWYVGLPDLPQTYDHETNNWSTNIGGVVGRVFPWKTQHLQIFGGTYYNSENNPNETAGKWVFKFNLSFLLPS
jgi:hypothetical protein